MTISGMFKHIAYPIRRREELKPVRDFRPSCFTQKHADTFFVFYVYFAFFYASLTQSPLSGAGLIHLFTFNFLYITISRSVH
ncbi:hypothetical protein BIV59_10790 [Bacillus sp. MUM 13]|nr:hypothetical protein BIV59_10790 [Bacillus sp. MUM 13]